MENLPPHIIKRISREVIDLSENPPAEGIKMYINEEDITDIQASIEGPGRNRTVLVHVILYTQYTYVLREICTSYSL